MRVRDTCKKVDQINTHRAGKNVGLKYAQYLTGHQSDVNVKDWFSFLTDVKTSMLLDRS